MPSRFTKNANAAAPGVDFVAAHFACELNRYSPENPEGYVNFGSAQNYLGAPEASRRASGVAPSPGDAHYESFAGGAGCRGAIADYLACLSGSPVDPAGVVVGNGVISLLEALGVALLDPGDTILLPTPVFPGLASALSLRSQSRLRLAPLDSCSHFELSRYTLEEALDRAKAEGENVKAVLVCSPGNPVGQVLDEEQVAALVGLAEQRDLALIVDEIYAGSCFDGVAFHSAVAQQSDRVFVLGGLSKDFGLAGYATGWLQSRNREVMKGVAKQSHFFRLPTPVQRVIESVLSPEWREPYLARNSRRLTESYRLTVDALRRMGVSTAPTEAGLCVWLDLRDWIGSPDLEGELGLYRQLLDEHRVHLSPGSCFHHTTPGYFRLCFSQSREVLREGLRRLERGLAATRHAPPLTLQA